MKTSHNRHSHKPQPMRPVERERLAGKITDGRRPSMATLMGGWLKMVDININLKVSGHEKLRDYLASGIGATAGPLLAAFAPWRALQEGKAKVIAAKTDAEVQKIQAATDVEVQRIQAATANGTSQLIAKEQDKARQYVVTPDALEPDGSVRIGFDYAQKAMGIMTFSHMSADQGGA